MKVNDFVRVLRYEGKPMPESSPDSEARVVAVNEDFVWLSNGNMPFLGSFSYEKFSRHDVSPLTKG